MNESQGRRMSVTEDEVIALSRKRPLPRFLTAKDDNNSGRQDEECLKAFRLTKRRRRELSVIIDEADNFSLVVNNSAMIMDASSTLPPKDSQRLLKRCQRRVPWPGGSLDSPLSVERQAELALDQVPTGEHYQTNSIRPSSIIYSDSLKFDFDEVVAHYP